MNELREEEKDLVNTLKNHFVPFLVENFTLRNTSHHVLFGKMRDIGNSKLELDYGILFRRPQFESWVSELHISARLSNLQSEVVKEHMNKLLRLIGEELEK